MLSGAGAVQADRSVFPRSTLTASTTAAGSVLLVGTAVSVGLYPIY